MENQISKNLFNEESIYKFDEQEYDKLLKEKPWAKE